MILSFGILTECRSEIVAMPGDEDGTFLFIAGATLVEAAYDAIARQPKNPLIDRLVQEGLKGVTILDKRTPADAVKWQKTIGNRFNAIASQESFLEVLQEVP
eukprot:1008785-Alexandrium_andersonii.AAC.1